MGRGESRFAPTECVAFFFPFGMTLETYYCNISAESNRNPANAIAIT